MLEEKLILKLSENLGGICRLKALLSIFLDSFVSTNYVPKFTILSEVHTQFTKTLHWYIFQQT